MGATDRRPVLVLQHVPVEGPGLIGQALAGHRVLSRTVVQDAAPDLPAARDLAGLVVLGGPMNAEQDDRFPGLPAERRLLGDAVDADVPVLGVCLGMQLLARALGATVHAGHGTQIGFWPVDVLSDDPVLRPLGQQPTVLHWHGDAADLPGGATLLATTATTPVQAFRAGSALGLQFHLEVDGPLLDCWLVEPAMVRDLQVHQVRPADLAAQAAEVLPQLQGPAHDGLAAFAGALRERG